MLIVAMLALIAVMCWLASICLSKSLSYGRGTVEDATDQARAPFNKGATRAERVEGLFVRKAKSMFDGFKRTASGRDGDEDGEGRGLLGGRYGGAGWRRAGGRYDGTSESSERATVIHREDCDGHCGMKSRRRSGGSGER